MEFHQGKIRIVKKFGRSTPILVPSFSSKGFPHVKEIHYYLKQKLTDASLVSAYDLYYGHLQSDQIYESDILFVDSGGYETNKDSDISEVYGTLYLSKEWNENLFEEQVSKLKPVTDIVLVNFDYTRSISLEEQIERAKSLFNKFPEYASDFLYKPQEKTLINVDNLIQKIELFSQFDIIGFTEKELGYSILERANNIFRIRKALDDAGLDVPMHIFGCLDPLTVVLYCLCGADVFDGLSWLRFSFKNGTPTYINHHALRNGLWERNDNEVKVISFAENLEVLSQLKNQLKKFINSSDWNDLGINNEELYELKRILNKIISLNDNK